jgi:glycosyltransferase involved in cell wall biosynthesis
MAPNAVTVSFRLGGDDGVSVEARKWSHALRRLGFTTRRVAGYIEDAPGDDDVVISALALDAPEPVDHAVLADALDGADLVIADNICSLPLNVEAARAVATALSSHAGRVVLRHHDLPWQRRDFEALEHEFPPRIERALHATINLRSRRELEARGYANVTTVHNYFDLDPPPGDRDATRAQLGFAGDDFVLFQPARAIMRKNVPGGLRYAHRFAQLAPELAVRYWLSGPAEDGYAPTLERILERAPVPVALGRAPSAVDAYAAADIVVFPSTWEGFGNPIVESIPCRRACAAYPYPVLAEIVAAGVRVFSTERPEALVKFLGEPEATRAQYFDTNVHRARLSFSLSELPGALEQAFAAHGWSSW